MVDFYTCHAVEKEPLDWKLFFTGRTLASLSSIYRALNCEHFYMPPASDQKPCIPALTPRGFETWMFTQLMSDPNRESQRLQKLVANWPVINPKTGHTFPKSIPRRCFPEKEDAIIADGWWRVWEEFPRDYSEESEDETTLALPAPGGGHHYPPREQMTPPEAMEAPFVPAGPPHRGGSKKIPMTMPMSYPPDDDEDDRRHGSSKSKSKAPRKPDPHWRESELNPRPILGEETRAAPPTRPHTSHGHHPSVDSAEKPRSSRQRDRSEYRHRRHQSRHQSRHRRGERSPSPDEGDWSGSSGISARTPGSGDGPPLDAPAPPPAGGSKRAEEVVREQREAMRRFEAQNARNRQYDDSYPDEFVPPSPSSSSSSCSSFQYVSQANLSLAAASRSTHTHESVIGREMIVASPSTLTRMSSSAMCDGHLPGPRRRRRPGPAATAAGGVIMVVGGGRAPVASIGEVGNAGTMVKLNEWRGVDEGFFYRCCSVE